MAVNSAVIEFYWELGKMIADKQTAWGTKFIEQLSKDLQAEFPDMKGLSERNLKYCRSFYFFCENAIRQQFVAQVKTISPQAGDEIMFNLIKHISWGDTGTRPIKIGTPLSSVFYIKH